MTNGNKQDICILIVDDIPDTVQLLSDWLEGHQYRTIGVTSSVKALEIAEQERPDLILLDIMMPKMDGMETCRRLKANPHTASIPVILVTAKNPTDARAEGIMAGAIDYITKPINLSNLLQRVEAALAITPQSPVDVQRLLEEVAHSALTILQSEMVWLLALDNDEQVLKSRILVTNAGSRAEMDFLLVASGGQPALKFPAQDSSNPFSSALISRQTLSNLAVSSLKDNPLTSNVFQAAQGLRLNFLTIVPLTAAGKTSGVMVMGGAKPQNMESPRASQILTSLASQAAIGLDYSRVMSNLTQRDHDMRREQAFREMILDTMSDGLVVIDSKGTIKYVNRRLLRMTNYARGYLEGRSVGELFHPDDRVELVLGLLREGATTMKFDQRLLTRDQRVIPVWLTRSRSQSDDLNNQVVVLSDMTEQKQREVELERQTGRLQALNKAAHLIASSLSLHETLKNILDSIVEVMGAQGASLFLFDQYNPDELVVVAAVGLASDVMQGMRVPVGEGVAGWVAREARSQLVADTANDPRFYRGVDDQTGLSTRSLIAVPLLTADRIIGVVEVVNKLNDELFDEHDVRLLESMAGTAAVSIVNARLFEATQRRVSELGTLLNASEAASSTLHFAGVLESIVHRLAKGLDASRCTIMAWNDSRKRLETLADLCNVGWTAENAPRRWLANEPLNRAALLSGMPVVASLWDHGLSPEDRANLEAHGMVSMMVVPLWVNGAVSGLADLYSTQHQFAYTDHHVNQVNEIVLSWQERVLNGQSLMNASESALAELLEQLMSIDQTNWITICAWNPGDESLLLLRERGFAEWTSQPKVVFPVEDYPTMRAVISEKQVEMRTIDMLADDPAEYQWILQRGGQSCLMLPLTERGMISGVITLLDRDVRLFDPDEVRLAQGIANVVSNAMENARLYQSLESRAKALESAYAELQEADKAKDVFIQNVSHELRTPLISVLGYAELLSEGAFGSVNDKQQEALAEITDKAQKLADLVQEIVAVQVLETQDLDYRPTDLSVVIREILERYRQRAHEANLRLRSYIPQNLPLVQADAKAIGEAFEKLLDNALKFGAGGEWVEIALQDTEGPTIQVIVRDHGIGIDPSEHHKIFQRFYQVDGGTARRFPGTGLGLSIAKSIVEKHGGRINVISKLDEGATFVFTVPKCTPAVTP